MEGGSGCCFRFCAAAGGLEVGRTRAECRSEALDSDDLLGLRRGRAGRGIWHDGRAPPRALTGFPSCLVLCLVCTGRAGAT